MTTKAAEDFEDIARRLKELEADRQLALTGSTAPEPKAEVQESYGDYAVGWPAQGRWADLCGMQNQATNPQTLRNLYQAAGNNYGQGIGMLSQHYQNGGLANMGRTKASG